MAKEIKNLRKVSRRIITAIKRKENIIICGDADLDGLASVIILKESIKNLGGEATIVYFPDRQREGYGLNMKSLSYFKKFAPALLITVDCGISSFKEAEQAEKYNLELIIIDHHEVLDRLPKASIIVDPKQKTDNYPTKQIAAAGIVFRLSCLLLG
ncbi:MAG: DHH family phosphoesterase, partial [bacterium]